MPSHSSQRNRHRIPVHGIFTDQQPQRASDTGIPYQWTYRSRSANETDRVGRMIGRSLHGGETIALYGELGSGKTALVRGIAAGLDGAPQVVSSPTFVLIQTYHGRIPLVHADLYRLHTPDDVRHLGLEDYFDGRSVIAVEWAEKADEELTSDRLEVYFVHLKRTRRLLNFRATGRRSSRLLTRVKKAHTDQLPASTKATRSKKTSPFNVQ